MLTAFKQIPVAFRQDSARELFTASESGETVHWNTPLTSLACKSVKDGFDMDNMCGTSVLTPSNVSNTHCLGSNELKSYILAAELVRRFLHLHLSWPPGLTFWSGGWLGRSRRIQTVSSLQESRMSHCKIGAYMYIYTIYIYICVDAYIGIDSTLVAEDVDFLLCFDVAMCAT